MRVRERGRKGMGERQGSEGRTEGVRDGGRAREREREGGTERVVEREREALGPVT